MKSLSIALLLFFGSSAILSAQTIDSEKSKVNFSISNMKWRTVEGSFSKFSGTANFNDKDLAKANFEISIPVSSIDTDNSKRDKHLQAEEYFNSAKYSNITFKSTFVNATATGIDITGKLTIKGVSKTVTIPFKYETTSNGYLLKGDLELDRYDYKVGSDGTFAMGRKVQLEILCYLKN